MHNRLYSMRKGKKTKNTDKVEESEVSISEAEYPFQPNMHSKKKFMGPKGRVTDRLMEDAKRRIKKREALKLNISKSLKKNSIPTQTKKTLDYAFKRFTKEYEEVQVDMNKQRVDFYNFQDMCSLLLRLGFISQNDEIDQNEGIVADVWIILGGESQTEVGGTSIYHILCIIMNFDKPFLYSKEVSDNDTQTIENSNENDKNTVGVINDSGIFYLRNKGEFQRLHSYFYDLTFNKINHTNKILQENKAKYGENEEVKFFKMNTFKPKIDSLSKSIEMSKNEILGKIPRYELLLSKGKLYQETNLNKTSKLQNKQLEDCTFVPNTSK